MTTERVNITTEIAKEILKGSTENRELSPQAVLKMRESLLESLLVGKEIRIYSEIFALLTQDFKPERVNIELDKSDLIKKVWFG